MPRHKLLDDGLLDRETPLGNPAHGVVRLENGLFVHVKRIVLCSVRGFPADADVRSRHEHREARGQVIGTIRECGLGLYNRFGRQIGNKRLCVFT